MSVQKVKLVLAKSYVENPDFNDTFSKNIEIELPPEWNQAHLIAARFYEGKSSQTIGGDINTTVITFKNESDILGKILTLADMSFQDKEQREAFKTVARDTLYKVFNGMRRNAVKTVDANERRDQDQPAHTN